MSDAPVPRPLHATAIGLPLVLVVAVLVAALVVRGTTDELGPLPLPPVSAPQAGSPECARLLAALPDADFARIQPHLQSISTRPREYLYHQGDRLENVYFPNGGVFSVTAVADDGTMVEAATIGDEGMVGIEAFLSDEAVAPGDTMMQVPGSGVV